MSVNEFCIEKKRSLEYSKNSLVVVDEASSKEGYPKLRPDPASLGIR